MLLPESLKQTEITIRGKFMEQNSIPLVIGNWYTQCSAGYWQLIAIKPKYAASDYQSVWTSQKKGERLGSFVILKKAFTPKMKKSLRCECVDSAHLKPVSDSVLEEINARFEQDPVYYRKYLASSNEPGMYVANICLKLTSDEEEALRVKLAQLPETFTDTQLESIAELSRNKKVSSAASGTHILYEWCNPWEITEGFDQLYRKAELVRLPEHE